MAYAIEIREGGREKKNILKIVILQKNITTRTATGQEPHSLRFFREAENCS